MKKEKNIYVQLVENYLSFLKGLSSEEIKMIEQKEKIIRFLIVPKSKKKYVNKNFDSTPKEPIIVDLIIAELNKINNREEGEKYLAAKCSNKVDLERIAKRLDVPFQKKDSINKLKSKIIERTIGFKLRSQAIQA